jgi:hypothetical protein
MKQLLQVIACIIALSIPFAVFAHPGHDHSDGNSGYTIIHYFTSPVHIISTVAAIAVVIGLVRAIRSDKEHSKN